MDSNVGWTSAVRLDDYCTVKALRRQIALVDKQKKCSKKQEHELSEEFAANLVREVEELCTTLRTFGIFSNGASNVKKRVDLMKRIRADLGDVFLCSLQVANSLDIDVARSVHEKIYPALKAMERPNSST